MIQWQDRGQNVVQDVKKVLNPILYSQVAELVRRYSGTTPLYKNSVSFSIKAFIENAGSNPVLATKTTSMKFISLTKYYGGEIAVNATMIVALEPSPVGFTSVHVFNHQSWSVKESVEEVQNKIKAAEGFAIINYDPKNNPRI